jgi:hypothetical protein
MSDEKALSNRNFAQSTQDKFEQYIIALTFTILALSIQSAHFGLSIVADIAECVSWVLLLVSGFFGLKRWESTPALYLTYAANDMLVRQEQQVRDVIVAGGDTIQDLKDGKIYTIKALTDSIAKNKEIVAVALKKANATLAGRFGVQKAFLYGGFLLLVFARTYIPVTSLLHFAGCPSHLTVQIDPTSRTVVWDSTTHAQIVSVVGTCLAVHRTGNRLQDSTTWYRIPVSTVVRASFTNPFAGVHFADQKGKTAMVTVDLVSANGVVMKADTLTYSLLSSPGDERMNASLDSISPAELASLGYVRVTLGDARY